jgi:glycosyl-4,4'-diaponeurosporenoate acyltransferase
MQIVTLPGTVTIVLDFLAWGFFHLMAGYVAWRLPVSAFDSENRLYALRRWEREGSFYKQVLFLHRWKDWLPEAGSFFPGGFSKKRICSRDRQYMERFVVETRRGEFAHWLSMPPALFFFLWNHWSVGLCMIAYALLFNLPFIATNRFNRVRLTRILIRLREREGRRSSSALGRSAVEM